MQTLKIKAGALDALQPTIANSRACLAIGHVPSATASFPIASRFAFTPCFAFTTSFARSAT